MNRLKELRVSNGLTLEALSTQVGIAASTYCQYENGDRSIPKAIAEKIAESLSCKVDDIFLPAKFAVSEFFKDKEQGAN